MQFKFMIKIRKYIRSFFLKHQTNAMTYKNK